MISDDHIHIGHDPDGNLEAGGVGAWGLTADTEGTWQLCAYTEEGEELVIRIVGHVLLDLHHVPAPTELILTTDDDRPALRLVEVPE